MAHECAEVVRPYLDWLQKEFGEIAAFVEGEGLTSDTAADLVVTNSRVWAAFSEAAPAILERATAFWTANEMRALAAAASLPGMRATFGGDIGPQRYFRQMERAGLYFDTLLVQDPLLRVARMPGPLLARRRAQLALKYGLELVWHRPIYLADVSPPIAVLIPDREMGGTRDQFDERFAETAPWAVTYWESLLGRAFSNYAEVEATVKGLGSTEAVLDAMVAPELFLMHADAEREPHAQWRAFMAEGERHFRLDSGESLDTPEVMLNLLRGRLMMANDILVSADTYNAHPLIGAPLSYHYTCWRAQAASRAVGEAMGAQVQADLAQTNGLLGAGLDWLGNVSQSDLVNLRGRGLLGDMRELLRVNSGRLTGATTSDIDSIALEVDHNLEQGFRRHKEEAKALDDKLRRELALGGAGLLVTATAAVQPVLFPMVPGWLAATAGLLGGNTLLDVARRVGAHLQARGRLGKTPIAILLDAKAKQEAH